jgi:hypothetical protein
MEALMVKAQCLLRMNYDGSEISEILNSVESLNEYEEVNLKIKVTLIRSDCLKQNGMIKEAITVSINATCSYI